MLVLNRHTAHSLQKSADDRNGSKISPHNQGNFRICQTTTSAQPHQNFQRLDLQKKNLKACR